jgi:hypothetical protein
VVVGEGGDEGGGGHEVSHHVLRCDSGVTCDLWVASFIRCIKGEEG